MSQSDPQPALLSDSSLFDGLDQLEQPLVLLDGQALIVWGNAAWVRLHLGRSLSGANGDFYPIAQLFSEQAAARLRAVCSGELTHCELEADALKVRAQLLSQAAPRRVLVSHVDTGEQGRLRQQLDDVRQQLVQAQKSESIGRLTNGVAHDFNNMLTSIICFTRFVVDDMAHEDPRRSDLIEVLKSADNAARLTNQLLAFSKRKPATPVQLNVHDALTSVGRVLRRTLGEHVELVIETSDDTLQVLCDPGQFDQLLFNLAIHAKDSLPAGGTISFSVGRKHVLAQSPLTAGEYVELIVSDNGESMSSERTAQAFDALLAPAFDRGSSLGLATCRAIVEHANGAITLLRRNTNTNPNGTGRGNAVRVLLPRAEDARRADAPRRPSLAPVSLRGTVLVVEDQPAILRTMVRALASTGLRVLEAASGEDALAVLEQHGIHLGVSGEGEPKSRLFPELVVTDVVLPRMSGPRLVECLRTTDPSLKVLYVSGYVGDDLAHSVRTDDNTAFVMKPFTGRQLAVRAAALMAGEGKAAL
ncbi:MAG: hypothetical protein RL701_5366 [Pseudomonadota bacterium]